MDGAPEQDFLRCLSSCRRFSTFEQAYVLSFVSFNISPSIFVTDPWSTTAEAELKPAILSNSTSPNYVKRQSRGFEQRRPTLPLETKKSFTELQTFDTLSSTYNAVMVAHTEAMRWEHTVRCFQRLVPSSYARVADLLV